MRLIVFDDFF